MLYSSVYFYKTKIYDSFISIYGYALFHQLATIVISDAVLEGKDIEHFLTLYYGIYNTLYLTNEVAQLAIY